MEILLKSGDTLVSEENGVVTVRPRMVFPLVLSLWGLATAAGLHALSDVLSGPLSDVGALARWGAAAVAAASLLLLLAAGCIRVVRRIRIEAPNGRIVKGRTVLAFRDVDGIHVRSNKVLDQEILTIVARTGVKDVLLVSGHAPRYRDALERTAKRMEFYAVRGNREPGAARGADRDGHAAEGRRFTGWAMVAGGAVASLSAFLTVPDLVLTRPRLGFAFLFWPLGIWIAAAGLVVLLGFPLLRVRGRRRTVWPTVLFLLLFASYCAVCFRPV